MNVLWTILWILLLLFIGWPVGFFCAGWYVCLSPFESCIIVCKDITEFLMKGVQLPLEIARHAAAGKDSW